MTSPAYDVKPLKPVRTKIDPVRTINALREGWRICFNCGSDPDKIRLEDMVWALIVEAAKVERQLPGLKSLAMGNGWPEIVRFASDHKFAQNARIEAGMEEFDGERVRRPGPSADQITRYEEVIIWVRFIHAKNKLMARDVLWGRASGTPYEVLRAETGLSISRMRGLKTEQLKIISDRLKEELRNFDEEALKIT